MVQDPQIRDNDRQRAAGAASGHPDDAAVGTAQRDNVARLQFWLIISGFVMMFAASILMWVRFGPSMFVDLATAVMNCF